MREDAIYYMSTNHERLVDYCCEKGYPMLISFHYKKDLQHYIDVVRDDPSKRVNLMIDSGAYTNVQEDMYGEATTMDAYIDFINKNSDYIDRLVQLDAIPATFEEGVLYDKGEETAQYNRDNYLEMRRRCVCPDKVMPVYHKGEPIWYLDWLLDFEPKIEVIGLSASIGVSSEAYRKWFDAVFDYLRKRGEDGRKYHGFGVCSFKAIKQSPWFTIDSSDFIQGGARFQMPYFDGNEVIKINGGKKSGFKLTGNNQHHQKIIDYWESFGYRWEVLFNDWWSRSMLIADIYNSKEVREFLSKKTFKQGRLL